VQLLATITNELEKMAGQTDADAIVLVDVRHNTLASVGRLAGYWPRGRAVNVVGGTDHGDSDGGVHATDRRFRVISVPLLLSADTLIGMLHVATRLDRAYARSQQLLSRTEIAMIGDGRMLGTTLGPRLAGEVEAAIARSKSSAGVVEVDGESQAFRRLFQAGDMSIYALASIEEASGPAIGMMMRNLALIAVGAAILGLVGSFWLARQLTEPIASSRRRSHRLPPPASSTRSCRAPVRARSSTR
jgi:hypothetical protein